MAQTQSSFFKSGRFYKLVISGNELMACLTALETVQNTWALDTSRPHRLEWNQNAVHTIERTLLTDSISGPRRWRE